MIGFGKSEDTAALGPLEGRVMEIVWRHGTCNVRDVVERISRPLAYTTVMTTLDRLYKKGLLERRKRERAFLYTARVTRAQWIRRRAGEFVANFFSDPQPERGLLLSYLLEAVEQHDAALLDDLNLQIQAKRQALEARPRRTKLPPERRG